MFRKVLHTRRDRTRRGPTGRPRTRVGGRRGVPAGPLARSAWPHTEARDARRTPVPAAGVRAVAERLWRLAPIQHPTSERTCTVPPSETWQKSAFATTGGPLQRKSGYFGPFPAEGKLLPVLLIYFLFETRPQKRCSALPDDNGTGKRRLQAHLRPFLSHFHHFGGQNGGRYGFRCPYKPQILTSCTQFAVRRSTCAIWDQSLGHTGQKMAKTALRGALEAKQEVEIWRRPHRSIF